ncbi:hypothetical protein A3Q56_02975 [Intoshia linei]|uniref:Mitochondrial import inner membrane translocase subunit TIM50 n=1 Tax=Intoshia linei TaxID=1819745 RepID=A0A177B6G2_9BILA|nr:hypothetical protein A3Q56_02975 [Intoshia linei]
MKSTDIENFDVLLNNPLEFYHRYMTPYISVENPFGLTPRKSREYYFNFRREMGFICYIPIKRKHKKYIIDEKENKKYNLILDLDGTIIYSTKTRINDADFNIIVNKTIFHVKKRPFLEKFLQNLSNLYNMYLFTASGKEYADKVLNVIDPKNIFFKNRFYREHCRVFQKNVIKDLSKFKFNLSRTIIIDNCLKTMALNLFCYVRVLMLVCPSYRFQPLKHFENGIPINTWISDDGDIALNNLIPFLQHLCHAKKDVRPILYDKFHKKFFKKNYENKFSL